MIAAHIEQILIVTGAATALAVAQFVAPPQVLRLTYGQAPSDAASLMLARHWGLLIGCIGILLIYSAFYTPVRVPVMVFAVIEKVAFGTSISGYDFATSIPWSCDGRRRSAYRVRLCPFFGGLVSRAIRLLTSIPCVPKTKRLRLRQCSGLAAFRTCWDSPTMSARRQTRHPPAAATAGLTRSGPGKISILQLRSRLQPLSSTRLNRYDVFPVMDRC